MKSSFYKWHRVLGLTALVPVIFWTISGLTHPFMSNWFRPFIPVEVFHPLTQAEMKPVLSIQQVMDANYIPELRNFSLVSFNKATYYQVLNRDSSYRYYSATDGKLLPYGDRRYAEYLARYFTQDTLSGIKAATLQTTFDGQYQPINHLLPVWKIAFDRPDGMDIYIETGQSRLATFNNNTRKCFLWVFDQFHTWRFLAAIGGEKFRIICLVVIVGIMLLSLISGLTVYILFWKKLKAIHDKQKAAAKTEMRFLHRYHRQIGIWVSFVMFTFAVSGGFHLLVKLQNLHPGHQQFEQVISRVQLPVSSLKLPVADSLIKKVSLASFGGKTYYLVMNNNKEFLYFSTADMTQLPDGNVLYARHLSNFYHDTLPDPQTTELKLKTTLIKQFDEEYGFINKRLPVEKVSYSDGRNWYIETATAKLATTVGGMDRAEGLSFIFLHKYFGMTWAGKNIRDLVSMFAAFGVLIVSLFGFASFINNKHL